MERIAEPGRYDFTVKLDPEDLARERTVPTHPYPAQKPDQQKEQAALDLTDAAQAATRAAILLDAGATAESDRLALLAQRLYHQADTHPRS